MAPGILARTQGIAVGALLTPALARKQEFSVTSPIVTAPLQHDFPGVEIESDAPVAEDVDAKNRAYVPSESLDVLLQHVRLARVRDFDALTGELDSPCGGLGLEVAEHRMEV